MDAIPAVTVRLAVTDEDPFCNQAFPAQPRKVKKWIKELPLVNMGETTREFYKGLRILNRQPAPAKTRLEIMELLRPTARLLLDHLAKHLVARSFPLPPRTHKIMELHQALLAEMAIGYKIIVQQAATDKERMGDKPLAVSVHRAMRYLSEQIVSMAQLYMPYAVNSWHEIYQLYKFAEQHRLTDKTIRDRERTQRTKTSVEEAFSHVCLLALARPQSLRQGEVETLWALLGRICWRCSVDDTGAADASGNVYHLNLSSDDPPSYIVRDDVPISSANRYFDLSQVIDKLSATAHAVPPEGFNATINRSVLNRDLSKRLLKHLTTNPKRRFGRAQQPRQERVHLAVGLDAIYQAISDDEHSSAGKGAERRKEPYLTLVPNERQVHRRDYLIASPQRVASEKAWDIVAKGNIVNDRTLYGSQEDNTSLENKAKPASWQTWEVVNLSAGGFRLRWPAPEGSRAQVGELVALRQREGREYMWHVGVIRWMQTQQQGSLEVGIQLLGPKMQLATVEDAAGAHSASRSSIQALMLPEIKPIKQPPTLLVPVGFLKPGAEVLATALNSQTRLRLTEIREHTGSFTQFGYTTDEPTSTSLEEPQEFESIWSAL